MMEAHLIRFCVVTLFILSSIEAEREEGDFLIGAVIPISKKENGTCKGVDYEGLAVSEAIRFAINEINKDDKLLGALTINRRLGFDIQDTCGSKEKEKDIAYVFNGDHRNYRSNTPGLKKPVSAVIGQFQGASVESMKLLNFEKIPQLSYAPSNAKLRPDGLETKDLAGLLSVYPEEITKMNAVASMLQKLKVEYTTLLAKKDRRGERGDKVLRKLLEGMDMCLSDVNMAKNDDDVKELIKKLKRKPDAKIVVLHFDIKDVMTALTEAAMLNMSDVIWISTVSMRGKLKELGRSIAQASGMIFIEIANPDSQGFKSYVENKGGSFHNESSWMKKAVKQEGGEKCAENSTTLSKDEQMICNKAIEKVKKNILTFSKAACFAIDAVYSIATALQSMLNNSPSTALIQYIKALEFQSPLTQNRIQFNSDGEAMGQSLVIYNVHGNSTLKEVAIGTWKQDRNSSLELKVDSMRFKQGKKKVPNSKCSKDCIPGEEIIYPKSGPTCCWTCKRCPNSTISNSTNSKCFKCKENQTPNPQQSSCFDFKQLHMEVKNPVSEFTLFFFTVTLLFLFFTMFIFHQNKDCEVMKMADNTTMQGLLFGITLVLKSSIVLILKPSFPGCIGYAVFFNIGLTIILGALITKTWLFRQLFYGYNETSAACCSRPGLFVVCFLLMIQAAILGLGMYMEKVEILLDDTDRWDVKYIECSLFRGVIFWVSYGFNVILSVLINFFNCGVPNVEARFGEYNWLCVTSCSFYGMAFFYIMSFWAFPLLQKIEVGVVLTVLHCVVFLLAYCYPKLHKVLFMNKEEMREIAKSERAELLYKSDDDDEETAHSPTSGIDVFKNRIVQLNYEPESDKASSK